jgi:HCOMODA/2-hydroxy-3-carboxy-muconic semialdehyde decarboxylase
MRLRTATMLALLAATPALAQPPDTKPDAKLVEDLVAANRILYDQGVVDGFGHVSARHDKDPGKYLLARSMAPGLVTSADILEFDLDSNASNAQGRAVYLERFIHGEIYKLRPDVKAVIHSHSPAIIPFGATGVPLKPIYHMSAFLGTGVPTFEIRDAGGPSTDMLVRSHALGTALAKSLGSASVLLMRGHGNVVVGDGVRIAVFRAVYTEINARLQSDAFRIGGGQVTYLNDQEAAKATEVNAQVAGRAWDLWAQKAMAPPR